MTASQARRSGTSLIALGAAAGFAISIFNYFSRSSGINGTEGTLLVVVSSAAICLAALTMVLRPNKRGWLSATLLTLILLGILGTGLAAYFLASTGLQVAMAISLIGWIVAILRPQALPAGATETPAGGKASS